MKKLSAFFLSFAVLTLSFSALGFEDSATAELARTRQYAGGADEEDLKVQVLPGKDQKNKAEANQEANEGF